MILKDKNGTITEIKMKVWGDGQYSPSWEHDFFDAGLIEYDEDAEVYIVDSVEPYIKAALDWKYGEGDYRDDYEGEEGHRAEDRAVWINGEYLVKAETVTEALNDMFRRLVPVGGAAKSVAGEIVRAICRIGHRYYNDGDHLGIGYGREVCNPAGRYLAAICDEAVEVAVNDAWEVYDDETYEVRLLELEKLVLDYLRKHPELETMPNPEDMWDYKDDVEDVDDIIYT